MIGLIYAGDIALCPFIKKYIKVLDEHNIDYEIIHWDRLGNTQAEREGVFTYSESVDRYAPRIKKLMPFYRFSRFATKTIKKRKYDKLVVLTTQTALYILPTLLLKYRKKFFFDYRDTSYEFLKPYCALVNKIANLASGVCISSPGFAQYVKPKIPAVLSHNFQDKYYEDREKTCHKNESGKITLGYIGILREADYIKKMIDTFGKDDRFQFNIHGTGDNWEALRDYSKKYTNVYVAGPYMEEEKRDILRSFDIICYNYPYSFVNYPALANKFYDGLIMKKPMYTNKNVFSGKLVEDNGLGIAIDENDTLVSQKIYDYYKNFNPDTFSQNCEAYLEKVLSDEKEYIAKIEETLCKG